MLEIRSMYSGYGKLRVLFDINMAVPRKEITVVVGPNGAGKTTLLNSISGIATIHSGDVVLEGTKVTGMAPYKLVRMGIAYAPQMGNIFSSLSVEENLKMASYIIRKEEFSERLEEVMSLFPVLKEFYPRRAGTLSGGERRMLAIAMALMRRPKVLMLDEPSTDLAPIMVKKVMDKVVELRDELGLTILLTEQMARKALEIGDGSYLLVGGTLRFSGRADELLHHPELARLYLGIR